MRLLMICPEYPPMLSGIGDYTQNLLRSLSLQSVHSIVLTSATPLKPREEELEGTKILRLISTWDWGSWDMICKHIEIWRPDIIHVQYMNLMVNNHPLLNFLPYKIRRAFPESKIVTTYHEFTAPWKRLALLPLFFFSDAHIVTNENHYLRLKSIFEKIKNNRPLRKIPLAANISPVESMKKNRTLTRLQLDVHENEILVVRFGILHDVIAPELIKIIDAVSVLAKETVPVKLLLLGKEELGARQRLNAEIKALNIQSRVIFKTELSPEIISAYLFASDIGLAIYPDGVSEKRTAFLSLLEHDLPVIATKKQALAAELEKNIPVELYEWNSSPESIAVTIKNLICDSDRQSTLRSNAAMLLKLHRWDEIAKSTAELYSSLSVR